MCKKVFPVVFLGLLISFYLCAAGSTACFFLYRLTLSGSFFRIGDALRPLWMFHPAPVLALFFGKKLGTLSLTVYFLCAIALVVLTGGI